MPLFSSYFRPSNTQSTQSSYSQRLAEKEKTRRRKELPKAVTKTAPTNAVRLTIFGSSNVISNLKEVDLSDSLSGIPIRYIPAKELQDFHEKIEMVCTDEIPNCIKIF